MYCAQFYNFPSPCIPFNFINSSFAANTRGQTFEVSTETALAARKMVEKNSVVDLGRREESVAEIPDGSSPVGFHGFRAAGWAGDNLANFIPKMGPRGNKGGGSTAEKERPRGVGRACTLESEDVPHSHARTRVHAHEYRFIAAMGATTPRRNENDPYRATHDVSAGRRKKYWI